MSCSKGERSAREMIKKIGLELVDMQFSGGGHIKAKLRAPDGREEIYMFANSISDSQHGNKNKAAVLKRFARGISTKLERHPQ